MSRVRSWRNNFRTLQLYKQTKTFLYNKISFSLGDLLGMEHLRIKKEGEDTAVLRRYFNGF